MNIIYKKLGEALRYAMFHELPNKECKEHIHFTTVVTYLALYGQITVEGMQKILSDEKILLQKKSSKVEFGEKKKQAEFEFRKAVERVLRIVSDELKEHMHIYGLDNVLEVLNQKEIPQWFIMSLEQIRGMFPNVAVVGDNFYFVERTIYGNHALMKIPLKEVTNFEPLDVHHPSVKDCVFNVIDIINVDYNMGRIDVTVSPDKQFFVEYNCDTEDQKIVDMKFLGTIGACEVGISNGYLSYRLDGEIYHLKEYSDKEMYEIQQGQIKVFPIVDKHTFFSPYIVSLDGNVIDIPENEKKDYLWKMIRRFVLNNEEKLDCELKEVTIEKITLSFEKKEMLEELCKNPRYAIMQGIFNLLRKYIDRDYDINRLLFMLFDVGFKLIGELEWFVQPFTEKLLWQLRRIELYEDEKLVREMFSNINSEKALERLKEKLLCDVISEKKSYETKVGCFQLDDSGKITKYEMEDISKAEFIGYMKCKKDTSNQRNLVMYYPPDNTYIVQTENVLKEKNKKAVLETFLLTKEHVRFITA